MEFAPDVQPHGSNKGSKRLTSAFGKLKQLLSRSAKKKEKKEEEGKRRQQPFPPPFFLSMCAAL